MRKILSVFFAFLIFVNPCQAAWDSAKPAQTQTVSAGMASILANFVAIGDGTADIGGTDVSFTVNDDGANSVCQTIDNDGTNHGLYIIAGGVLATSDYALYVLGEEGQNQTNAAHLVKIHSDDADSTHDCLNIGHDGTGNCIYTNSGGVLASGKHGAYFYSNAVHTTADTALVNIVQENAAASEPAFQVRSDASVAAGNAAVEISSNDSTCLQLSTVTTPSTGSHQLFLTTGHNWSGADSAVMTIYASTTAISEPMLEIASASDMGIEISVKAVGEAIAVTQGNVVIGGITAGATADEVLALHNSATAPTNSADLVHFYAKDFAAAAGHCGLAIYQEDAVDADADETKFSHKLPITINGSNYYIMLSDS